MYGQPKTINPYIFAIRCRRYLIFQTIYFLFSLQYQFIMFRYSDICLKIRCRLFRFRGFFVCKNPEAEAQRSYSNAALNYKTEREHK